MRRSLFAAVADQEFSKLNQPLFCSLLAYCNSHGATSASLLTWQSQQQCTRGVRTKAQPDLRTRAGSLNNKQPTAAAAHSDDDHDSDAQWQPPPPRYLQRGSMSRDKLEQQHSRPGPASSNKTNVRQQDLPPKYSARQLALQHNLPRAKRQQQHDSSTPRDWQGPYKPLREEVQQHWQQYSRSSRGHGSRSDREDGRMSDALPSGWRTKSQQSAAGAAAVAGTGAVWHGILQETGSSSSRSPARHARDSSQSPSAAAITPAFLTKAISSSSDLQQLQQLLSRHKDSLQQINICAAFKAVVRLSPGSSRPQSSSSGGNRSSGSSETSASLAVMRQLSSRMLEQIRIARPWDLAQAAWACSKLRYKDAKLLDSIAQQVQVKSPILLPQDISQLGSAYARLGYKHPQLMQLLQQQAIRQAAVFKPWSLIHTAWALQVSGTDPQPLLHVITQQLQHEQLAGLQPLDIATLLWLMAAHAVRDVTLLTAVQKQLTADIASYPPAAAAQALISLAGLSVNDQELALKAAAVVLQDLQQQQQQRDLADQQQQQYTSASRQYGPKHVTHATFALVQLGQGSQQLLDAAASAFLSNPGGYSPGLLCMLCWAFPLAGITPPEIFTVKLVEQCLLQLKKFTADQLASILRGMLALERPHSISTAAPQLMEAACTQLPQQLQHISTPVLAKLIITLSKQCRDTSAAGQYTAPPAAGGVGQSTSLQQQQQQLLFVLLQQCGEEWLQQGRINEGNAQQQQHHSDVQRALRLAGLTDLAAAAASTATQATQPKETAAAAAAEAAAESAGDASAVEAIPQQQQQQPLQDKLNTAAGDATAAAGSSSASAHVGPVGGATAGTWLDSFVATADDSSSSSSKTA